MVDFYTKAALTVIGGALVLIVVQNAVEPARSQIGCGHLDNPCFVVHACNRQLNRTLPPTWEAC
jgi:hypothetical protein